MSKVTGGELIFSLVSSLLNAISIMILQIVYNRLALVFTRWENHRTQTEFEDPLVLKRFVFNFINSYVSLYYIGTMQMKSFLGMFIIIIITIILAFFRGGTLILGRFQDTCTNDDCMTMLTVQVLVMVLVTTPEADH